MLSLARLAFATTAIVAMTYPFATLNVNPGYAKGNFFSFFRLPCSSGSENKRSRE